MNFLQETNTQSLNYYELKGGFHTFVIRHIKNFIHCFWNIHFVLLCDSLVTTTKRSSDFRVRKVHVLRRLLLSKLVGLLLVGLCVAYPKAPMYKMTSQCPSVTLRSSPYTQLRTNTRWDNFRDKAHQLKRLKSLLRLFTGREKREIADTFSWSDESATSSY